MKLYATITSERASKGQGGNQFLEIEIQAEKVKGIPTRTNVFRINIDITDDGFLLGSIFDYSTGERILLGKEKEDPMFNKFTVLELKKDWKKGEKQKGECNHGEGVICVKCSKYPLI